MILHEVLYVTPSSPRILMLDRFKDDDPELLAQPLAENYDDAIYFLVDLVLPVAGFGPDLEITWMNWYGKTVTSNTYLCASRGESTMVEQLKLTDTELEWFLKQHHEANLFIYNEDDDRT